MNIPAEVLSAAREGEKRNKKNKDYVYKKLIEALDKKKPCYESFDMMEIVPKARWYWKYVQDMESCIEDALAVIEGRK